MLGWEYPPKISGGLGIASQGIAKGLAQSGVSVDFVLPKIEGRAARSTTADSSKRLQLLDANDFPTKGREIKKVLTEISKQIKYLEVGTRLMPYLTVEEFETIAERTETQTVEQELAQEVVLEKIKLTGGYTDQLLQEVVKYGLAVINVTKQREFDVIHAHDWMTFEAGIMAREVSGKPLVLHIHSTEYDRSSFSPNPAIFEIEKRGLEHADKIIAVSGRVKKLLTTYYDIPAGKIEVVYNAIDAKAIAVASPDKSKVNSKKVLFVGRLTAQKGPERFIDIAIELHKQYPDITFTIAGDGYLRLALEEKVKINNLQHAVKFLGFMNHKKVLKLMGEHDLALLPSTSEPFGLTPMEVILCGTPVVASRESGVIELVKSMKNVHFWDTFQWVSEAKSLLDSESRSAAYIKKVRSEIVRLNWKLTGEEIKEIYQSLI
jgi:glycogen(starch) synthase